jgi:hypothetical protein
MNTETNYASLFYSESQTDLDFLEKTVADFPVSSAARFLLLYHHKKNNLPGFDELAKQTGIYLNNPLWIQFQLSQIEKSAENKFEILLPEDQIKEEEILRTEREEEIVFDEKKEISESAESEDGQEFPTIVNEQITEIPSSEIVSADEESKENSLSEIKEEELVNEQITEIPSSEITSVDEENKENSLSEIKEEELVNEQITEIPSSEIVSADEESKENSLSEIKEEELVNEQITEIPSSEIVSIDEERKEESLVPEIQPEENIHSTKETEERFSSEDRKNMVAENPDPEEENLVEDKTVSDIKIPQEEVQKEKFSNPDFDSENDEETISFEPLHTVDYFASQGIKIDEEALANDHLVKQVKSFTAWLKTMKKLHPGQLPEQNEVIEKIIQSASEASNQDANVLTEAMAEVLTKQGKREKAIEMYEKLSLINPSKSAYFAAKIESLKII